MVTAISTLPKPTPAERLAAALILQPPGPALCVKPGSTVLLTELVAKALQRSKREGDWSSNAAQPRAELLSVGMTTIALAVL